MHSKITFPQKLALGRNFCNRIKEQDYLHQQIAAVRPTLIISPRRYGKTSLGVEVLDKLTYPYTHLDLFPLLSIDDVKSTLLGGVGDLLAQMENTPQKALKAITEFFGGLSMSFTMINTKVEVKLNRGNLKPQTLQNALKNLDATLHKKNKKAVLFLDEFQRLAQMPNSEEVEGAIRHVAQQSKNLVFLFSGSNRHLLEKMFDDSHRPLYKLCDRLTLNRIDSNEYISFMQKKAQTTWKKKLPIDALEAIFECTDCHPYYINALCHRLWSEKNIFDRTMVFDTWHDYTLGEKSTVFREVENLSENQLKLLISLARFGNTKSILSEAFLRFSQIPQSSAKQSLAALEQKDFIDHIGDIYRVLDPLIKYVLSGEKISG